MMWWKIVAGIVTFGIVLLIGPVIKMAIDEIKEEIMDIQKADKRRKP